MSSRVGFERCALTELLEGTKLCASGRRSGEQRLERDRRLLRDLACAATVVSEASRGSMPETVARASASATAADVTT